jgi:hypothetical protein
MRTRVGSPRALNIDAVSVAWSSLSVGAARGLQQGATAVVGIWTPISISVYVGDGAIYIDVCQYSALLALRSQVVLGT